MVVNKTPNTGMYSVHSFRHAQCMFIFGPVIFSFTFKHTLSLKFTLGLKSEGILWLYNDRND